MPVLSIKLSDRPPWRRWLIWWDRARVRLPIWPVIPSISRASAWSESVAERVQILLDTGPWVALLSRNDNYHQWAVDQFAAHAGPFYTCEAVVAETCFLLARAGFDASVALQFIERGVVQMPFVLQDQIGAVRQLFARYDYVPASLADASLVRLSELMDACALLTLDGDFTIYRRHGRKTIPLMTP